MNNNSTDIKVFIINLKRSSDRKEVICNKLKKFSITAEFIDAVDGQLLSEKVLQKVNERTKWYQEDWGQQHSMKRGEIGVAMSHYQIYKRILAEKIPEAIILEDDADFDHRLRYFVQNSGKLKMMMNSFDLILLGFCDDDLDYNKRGDCSYWGRVNIDKIFRAGIPVKWYWSAIAYVISIRGAKLLAEKQGEFPCVTADILTGNSPRYGVRLGVLRTPIVWPGMTSSLSTIQVDTNISQLQSESNLSHELLLRKSKFADNKNGNSANFYTKIKLLVGNIVRKLKWKQYLFTNDRY